MQASSCALQILQILQNLMAVLTLVQLHGQIKAASGAYLAVARAEAAAAAAVCEQHHALCALRNVQVAEQPDAAVGAGDRNLLGVHLPQPPRAGAACSNYELSIVEFSAPS